MLYFTPVGKFHGERLPYENPILPGPNLWTRSRNRLVIKGLNFHKGLFLKPNCFFFFFRNTNIIGIINSRLYCLLPNILKIFDQMVVLGWAIVNLSKNSFNNKKKNNRKQANLILPTSKRRIKGNLGYSQFQKWENRNFRLENQMARAIPSGKVQKNTDSDLTRCKFSLFILFSKLGYTL